MGLDLGTTQCSGRFVKAQAVMSHSPVSGCVMVERVPEWMKTLISTQVTLTLLGLRLAVEKHNLVKLSHGPGKEI